ncbi:MAG: HlyC/CorC family transporter [Planctomycetes bacterium]|nr:HlyC/CorC family transporter [Planctomycetota bacterium]
MEERLLWGAGALSLAASVLFSLAEGALLEFSRTRLEEMVGEARRERFRRYLDRYDSIFLTTVTLDKLANVTIALAATVLALRVYRVEQVWAFLAAFFLVSTVVIVFGEALPRALGHHRAEGILSLLLPGLHGLSRVLRPFVWPLEALSMGLARLAGARTESPQEAAAEEILDAVEEGVGEGAIEKADASMIESIIEFKDVSVAEVMTPRTEMLAVDASMPLSEVVQVLTKRGRPSRIPVHDGTPDRIVGVLYVKDLLGLWGGQAQGKTARDVCRRPYFVPASKRIADLFEEFRAKHVHFAVALDEYGGTAGIVTIEDILEEIVGEIRDEYEAALEQPFRRVDEHTVELSARVPIEDINEALGIRIPEDDGFETVGGFIFNSMGKVPAAGETYVHENLEFRILDADERRIGRVRLLVRDS